MQDGRTENIMALFGSNNDSWVWILVIIILIIALGDDGLFGQSGCGCGCQNDCCPSDPCQNNCGCACN